MAPNMTSHARNDRMARLEYIVDTVGIGKVMCESCYEDRRANYSNYSKQLTSTGVIILRSANNDVITAYIATFGQALEVWQRAFGSSKKMLPALSAKVRANENYRKNQPC